MRRKYSSGWRRSLGSALCIAACACGGDGGTPPAGPEDPESTNGPDTTQVVDSITMKPAYLYIDSLGVRRQTSARALTEDSVYVYSSVDHPDRFVWSSSAPEILSVDENGTATSQGWGVATLTARHEGDLAGTLRVVVREAVSPAWSLSLRPGTISAGIAVGPDGTIYAGTNEPAEARSIWSAISPQEEVLWSIELPTTQSMPAIGEDGTLYFGSRALSEPVETAGVVTAVSPDGSVLWDLEGLNGIRVSPAIGPNGTIYVAGGRHVHAISPQGEIQWSCLLPLVTGRGGRRHDLRGRRGSLPLRHPSRRIREVELRDGRRGSHTVLSDHRRGRDGLLRLV